MDGGSVEIAAHLVYELDPDGKQLRVVKFTDYTAEKVRSMYASAAALRSKWSDAEERAAIIQALEERGISFDELAEAAKQPDADPFDLLCHVAFNAPLRTRRERAELLRKEKKDFFDQYAPEARAVLNEMLDKYIEYGTAQFQIPDILKVPPISERGTVTEIAALFGGAEKLRAAVTKSRTPLCRLARYSVRFAPLREHAICNQMTKPTIPPNRPPSSSAASSSPAATSCARTRG